MAEVLIMGEMLVEIMRPQEDIPLDQTGLFKGPFPSGAPAIFIDTVARMGHSAAIIGGVGHDDFGENILTRLKRDGVDVSHVIKSHERATGVAFVTYFSDGSRKFIFHMGNTPAVEAKAPSSGDFTGVRYMHIMGCSLMANKDFAQEILKTMRMVLADGGKISFDPNIRKELFTDDSINQIIAEVMQNTSVFLPGTEELLLVTGENSIEDAIRKCFSNEKMDVVVLKRGSKGCTVYTRDAKVDVAAYPVKQVDATGAGDCFDGAFIAGLLDGKNCIESAKMGAAAGALNAAAFGPMEGDISPATISKVIESNA